MSEDTKISRRDSKTASGYRAGITMGVHRG